MAINSLYPVNLLSHDDDPGWKVQRFPFVDAAPEVLAKMLPGFLVKFDATAQKVLPALAADDAVLGGVMVDLLSDVTNLTDTTVLVAMSGSFNQRLIHYADAWSQGASPTPLSPAAIERLRTVGIFLDPSVPTGAFSP
jgi:hypothetical protein